MDSSNWELFINFKIIRIKIKLKILTYSPAFIERDYGAFLDLPTFPPFPPFPFPAGIFLIF